MVAEQLSTQVYEKLVSLNYARKANDFIEAGATFFPALDKEVKEVIKSLPKSFVDVREDLMDIDTLDGKQQFFLFENEMGIFLIDTQGYNYPRYITRLDAFEDEDSDDSFERMDGLARIADVAILQSVVKSLVFDLEEEGFDRADIINFIDAKIFGALSSK